MCCCCVCFATCCKLFTQPVDFFFLCVCVCVCVCVFRTELEAFVNIGILSKLIMAVSREPEWQGAHYVQDGVTANSAEVAAMLLEKKAVLYVCG